MDILRNLLYDLIQDTYVAAMLEVNCLSSYNWRERCIIGNIYSALLFEGLTATFYSQWFKGHVLPMIKSKALAG
jgi:hypothetical protein